MPDTGAPWNIPYAAPTDLVRDWPALSEDVADQVAAGLSATGGLVEVKSAIFTGTQTASVTASSNVAVTSLSITHETANVANRLIISAFFGVAADSNNLGRVGIAIHDGTGLIAIGEAAGSRSRVTAGGRVSVTGANTIVTMPSVTFIHTPGAGSKTYTVRAINIDSNTRTLYINRTAGDSSSGDFPRGVSSLVIQEIKV